MIHHANTKQMIASISILMSNKMDFYAGGTLRDKEEHNIMIKLSNYQE